MKVTINTTELTAIDCYAFEHVNGKRELHLTVSQDVIDCTSLATLISTNKGDITLVRDDGSSEIFVGYKTTGKVSLDLSTNNIEAHIECVGEAERIAAEAAAAAAAAETKNAELTEQLVTQSAVLDELLTNVLPSLMAE